MGDTVVTNISSPMTSTDVHVSYAFDERAHSFAVERLARVDEDEHLLATSRNCVVQTCSLTAALAER
jgi:hypothetical protein